MVYSRDNITTINFNEGKNSNSSGLKFTPIMIPPSKST